jgi:hypothetical protein
MYIILDGSKDVNLCLRVGKSAGLGAMTQSAINGTGNDTEPGKKREAATY